MADKSNSFRRNLLGNSINDSQICIILDIDGLVGQCCSFALILVDRYLYSSIKNQVECCSIAIVYFICAAITIGRIECF